MPTNRVPPYPGLDERADVLEGFAIAAHLDDAAVEERRHASVGFKAEPVIE